MNNMIELKERNLNLINAWCKRLMNETDGKLDCGYILRCNNVYYKIIISKDGIVVKGSSRFCPTLMVDPSFSCDENLIRHTVGTELIYQWKEIKEKILDAYITMRKNKEWMINFEV